MLVFFWDIDVLVCLCLRINKYRGINRMFRGYFKICAFFFNILLRINKGFYIIGWVVYGENMKEKIGTNRINFFFILSIS